MAKIELTNVSIAFSLRQTRNVTLKEYLLKGLFLESNNPLVSIRAINDLTLHARVGDRIGVIGHNGAGKSTLLKLIAGIYQPNQGSRVVEGKICSLFDLVLGFEMEATGWENIAYRGYLQGETPRTLKNKKQEIADFTELGDFLNIPVRYYSAGMMIRLAFSIATAVEPEILLVDEVLGVGDMAFQIKARQRMREMMNNARLMVMVSHDLVSIGECCSRVLWMQHGTVMADGPAQEVIARYQASVNSDQESHVGATTSTEQPVAVHA